MTRRYVFYKKTTITLFLFLITSYSNADLIIQTGETFTLNSATSEIISFNNDLLIEDGGLFQGASNTEIRVNGNWDNSYGGNYIHGNSRVFFTGSGVSRIQGSNHFYHLVVNKKDASSDQKFYGSEIQIESGTTQTISSQLFLNGATIDDRLKIRSTTSGESHTLDASGAAYVEAWFLDVDDSIFIGAIDMPMLIDSSSIVGPIVGSGNNVGWIANAQPVANAGPDQSLNHNTLVTLDGSNSSDPDGDTYTYAWTQSSGTVVMLTGATTEKPTFTAPTLGANDNALTLVFSLAVTDNKGSESVADTVSITVIPPAAVVTLSGTAIQNQTLYLAHNLSNSEDLGGIGFQWQADNEDIVDANQSSYFLKEDQVGKTVRVIVSYTNYLGEPKFIPSNSTVAVENINDEPQGQVIITGIVGENQILTADVDLIDADGMGVISYQWLADGINIVGATSNTYQLSSDDVNKTLTVIASYIDARGEPESVSSENTTTEILALALHQLIQNIDNNTQDLYVNAGITGVSQANLNSINNAFKASDVNTQIDIQRLVDRVVASHIIQAYNADHVNNPAPVLSNYQDLDLNNINSSHLENINNAISALAASDIDSIDKIITVLTMDTDTDSVIDIIDSFPLDSSETLDSDGDSFGDNSDNCPNIANPSQANFDSDSMGDMCDPDEDNDGVISSEDAFKLNPNYSADSDNDGMPDAFENQYGFDVNNSLDRATDSDGDGVSNLDEFLAGSNPRVNPNPGLPQLVIPDDIELISTGRMTAVDIGVATAIDGSNTVLQPIPSFIGPFSAGRHEIIWSATDALGNQSKAVQVVKILPLVNLTPSSLIAEGGSVEVTVVLSGDAADYPVRIPYSISGSATNSIDYQLEGTIGVIAIEQGREASFAIQIKVDDELENNETIEVQILQPTNAALGSVTQRTISIIDGNLPPRISVIVEQGDNLGRVIAADKGAVTITAEVSDPNPEDSHSFDWQLESEQASAVVSETTQDHKKTLIIDPSQLKPGVFSIAAKATDSADIVATTEVKTDFRLMEAAPDLSSDLDSDGDGVSDADEGYDDSDNDGIVDYMDNIIEPNLAPVSEDSTAVLQAAVGTQIVLGEMAFSNAESTVTLSKQQVLNVVTKLNLDSSLGLLDKNYTYPYGLYDFAVSGEIPGSSYYLVLPLKAPFEEGQVFRKYMGPQIGWQNFIENANNLLFSAVAIEGACPEPGSRLFVSGLKSGHNCVQLYIEDGGPNDLDGIADGKVTDPGGIAILSQQSGAPSVKNSSIELERTILATEGDKAIITIRAFDEDNNPLEGVNIVTSCNSCKGVTISKFSYQQQGVYTAYVVSGSSVSNGPITAILSNENGSATLESKRLVVTLKRRGGCTLVKGQPADISLILILFLITLFNYRNCRIDDD